MYSVFAFYQSSKMNEIFAIIDMDGFLVRETFYCKELGTLKVGEDEASSFFFDIGIHRRDITLKEQRRSMFVTKHIHKLPFGVPRGVKAFQLTNLDTIVKDFYNSVKLNNLSNIAYKGGHFEQNYKSRQQIWKVLIIQKLSKS